jgi:hypothetical protein
MVSQSLAEIIIRFRVDTSIVVIEYAMRSLIENSESGFSQQPLVIEFVNDYLNGKISLINESLGLKI